MEIERSVMKLGKIPGLRVSGGGQQSRKPTSGSLPYSGIPSMDAQIIGHSGTLVCTG